MANIVTRTIERLISKGITRTEGQPHDGPWWLPITGGWLPAEASMWNWWQCGYDPATLQPSAMVEACISAYARTVAMAPGDHWRMLTNNGRERVTTSAASRIVRRPNDYQSISDLLYNAVRQLFLTGNAYAYAPRNDRFEVAELHLMLSRASAARIAPTTGDVFYHLGGNEVIESRLGPERALLLGQVPARDVLHIRLNTPRSPLIGESPLISAMADMAASGAMTAQQIAYYMNQARPSLVLSTDHILTREQVQQLRTAWDEQAKGLNAGGTPILTSGLKPHPLGGTADDAQFVQAQDAADRHIALALGVPLQVLGIGKTTFSSTEAMMQAWLAGGLGFVLNHIELAFDRLFGMKADEYVEFDTAILLRSNEREQMDTLKTAIGSGVNTVNEARARVQLAKVEGGDQVYLQQQYIPLGSHADPQAPQLPAPPPQPEKPDAARQWERVILGAADAVDRCAA